MIVGEAIFVSYVSKCVNKTAEVAAYALTRLMFWLNDTFGFANVDRINFWFDSGPHFKSYLMAWTVLDFLPRVFTDILIWLLNWFAEKHGKSVVDMDIKRIKQFIVAYTDVFSVANETELATAVRCIQERVNFDRAQRGLPPTHRFIDSYTIADIRNVQDEMHPWRIAQSCGATTIPGTAHVPCPCELHIESLLKTYCLGFYGGKLYNIFDSTSTGENPRTVPQVKQLIKPKMSIVLEFSPLKEGRAAEPPERANIGVLRGRRVYRERGKAEARGEPYQETPPMDPRHLAALLLHAVPLPRSLTERRGRARDLAREACRYFVVCRSPEIWETGRLLGELTRQELRTLEPGSRASFVFAQMFMRSGLKPVRFKIEEDIVAPACKPKPDFHFLDSACRTKVKKPAIALQNNPPGDVASTDDDSDIVDSWAICSRCGKERVVPLEVYTAVRAREAVFVCPPEAGGCDAPQSPVEMLGPFVGFDFEAA